MPNRRQFLTAQWRDLLLLNFDVPSEALEPLVPAGTELDHYQDRTWVSVVGFMFRDTRLLGVPIPGHRSFEEVNLRFYVRRFVAGKLRRGVVFVREIVPRRAVTAVARWAYRENYRTLPMYHRHRIAGAALAAGDRLEYGWRTVRRGARRWNRMAAQLCTPLCLPHRGSLTEFLIEHYWGYTAAGNTNEYRVDHLPWRVADVADVVWDCDAASIYPTALARHLDRPPHSAFVAEGSAVSVFARSVLVPPGSANVDAPRPVPI